MTNEVKKQDITQEQIDFIIKDLKRFNWTVDPSLCKAQEGVSAEEWLQNVSKTFSRTPEGSNPLRYIQTISPFVVDNFSEKSDSEKIYYITRMPERGNATNIWMYDDKVTSATTFDDFKNNLLKIAKDPKARAFTYPNLTNGGTIIVKDTEDLAMSRLWCIKTLNAAEIYSNFPATPKPEPEPVIEKPNWFETTSKDHKVRVEQWMEHVGMKAQAQALIDKYGLPVAYEIVQTSMQSPKEVATATDGAFRNSKDSIKYFLDNSVSVEKLATLPDLDTETVKASILSTRPEPLAEGPTIEMPSRVVSVPSDPKLSQFDAQKVHYAAIMRDTLKLEGIDENEIKAAVDVAFKANLDNTSVDMESWTGAFKYNLVKALGLEEIAKDKNVYRNWAIVLNDCSESVLEASATGKTSEELKDQVEIYTTEVNKKTLKGELASMSATETLNPETYFKDRQVQKQLLARAEKKAEREAKKAERAENRQERRDNLKEWFNNTAKSIVD